MPHKPNQLSDDNIELYDPDAMENGNAVGWDGDGDPHNPHNWTKGKKWLLTVFICVLALTTTAGSSIYTPGVVDMADELDISLVVATLPLSMFVLGWAFGPLLFGPMSEVYGRNLVYRISWSIFTIIQLPCALTKDIAMLLVFRFIGGLASGAPITICAGSVTDIWSREEMGPAVALVSMSAYMGPAFGPIIGGYLTQGAGWRWAFWFMLIACGVLGCVFVLLPETYGPTLLERKAHRISKETGTNVKSQGAITVTKAEKLRISISRPIRLLVGEPVVFFMCLYLSFVIAVLNLYFAAYVIIFQGTYKLRPGDASLPFLGIAVGVFIATGMAGMQNKLYLKLCQKHGGLYPEARLPYQIIGGCLLPASLFWFAWTAKPGVNKLIPIFSGIPFGWSLLMIMFTGMGYLMDAYREYSASAMASLTLLRSLLSLAFPLFAQSMYNNLGHEWASSVMGFIAVGLLPIPALFFRYGRVLRSKSDYTYKG